MNKYQKYLLGDMSSNCYLKNSNFNIWAEDKLVLRQNEDITIKDYILYIANNSIESVFAMEGTIQTPFNPAPKGDNQYRFCLPIDFDHKIDSIKIVFRNNLADDLILPVVYEEADKEAYYAKVA